MSGRAGGSERGRLSWVVVAAIAALLVAFGALFALYSDRTPGQGAVFEVPLPAAGE